MKKILSIFLLAFSGLVQAACPNFVDGTVLTSAALNSAFAAPCITGGSVPYSVLTGTVPIWNQSTTGNAATATTATNQSGGSVSATLIANSGGYTQNGKLLLSSIAPTIASGFGTTPSIVNSNGTASFAVNVGTGGTASSGVVTLPSATTNWNCAVINSLSGAGTLTQQSAHSSTSVTLTNYTISTDVAVAWTASYVIELNCVAK